MSNQELALGVNSSLRGLGLRLYQTRVADLGISDLYGLLDHYQRSKLEREKDRVSFLRKLGFGYKKLQLLLSLNTIPQILTSILELILSFSGSSV